MDENNVAARYDLRGLKCPLPVLKTKKRMTALEPGARIWVETSDPLATVDIPHFCSEYGHKLLETHSVEGGHRFLIEKGS
ncbi:sulfurtransferase TusA family protein [Hoeflea sp. TYP-13]|uniref:sulfurtransferase TusA family protein n=1 Tax=Hoeflea sp. TYP-13 TaxID=3230023 RepID=UPI0034C638F3